MEIQQAGVDLGAVVSIDRDGDLVFETLLVTIANVTGQVDQSDLNLGTLV